MRWVIGIGLLVAAIAVIRLKFELARRYGGPPPDRRKDLPKSDE